MPVGVVPVRARLLGLGKVDPGPVGAVGEHLPVDVVAVAERADEEPVRVVIRDVRRRVRDGIGRPDTQQVVQGQVQPVSRIHA